MAILFTFGALFFVGCFRTDSGINGDINQFDQDHKEEEIVMTNKDKNFRGEVIEIDQNRPDDLETATLALG
jgi:hypothetical protein